MNAQTKTPIRNWLFIGGLIVLAVIVFGIWVASRVDQEMGTLLNRTDEPSLVAVHYYEAMRSQNYTAAYADFNEHIVLNGQPLDQESFVKLAAQADAQQGKVTTYNLLETQGKAGDYDTHLTRGSHSYTVHLELEQRGRIWKITSINGL